jgi:hypothetical protein
LKPEIQVFNNILAIEGLLESQKIHSQPSSPPKVHTPPSPHISQPSSPPKSPTSVVHTMVVNRMDVIIAARYAPMVLPQVLYAFPVGDYMKYFPRFNGEGEVTTEEHLSSFYSFTDNFNVEHTDVWMRLFV